MRILEQELTTNNAATLSCCAT